jgi:hypothetical protein
VSSPSIPVADFIAVFGDEGDGDLPDGRVMASTHADWRVVIEAFGRRGWPMTRNDLEGGNPPTDADDLRDRLAQYPDGDALYFAAYPHPDVRVNLFPCFGPVIFDFDRRECVDQRTVDALCELIAEIGDATAGTVILTLEGSDEVVLASYAPVLREFRLDEPWVDVFES